MFTVRQGEHLAFIHSYATKVGVSPSLGFGHRRSAARR
jgi:hypothetical protein